MTQEVINRRYFLELNGARLIFIIITVWKQIKFNPLNRIAKYKSPNDQKCRIFSTWKNPV